MELDFEQLYKKYRDNIFAIGLNYFGNPSDADDIVQETFYKLSKNRTDFESEEHIRNCVRAQNIQPLWAQLN